MRTFVYFIAPICAWLTAQGLKILTRRRKRGEPELTDLVRSGGMPSSHMAFMTSLAMVIGLRSGFDSGLFALCAALAAIIGYDAAGVRRTTGDQTTAIHELQRLTSVKAHTVIHPSRGHSFNEIVAGAITGAVIGAILHILL
jgi:acid phosphatase family membrane protein YuiD